MDGGGIKDLLPPSETGDRIHYIVQFLTFGMVVILMILVIALLAGRKSNKGTMERYSNRQKIANALRRSGSGTVFGTEGMTMAQQRKNVVAGLQQQERLNASMDPNLIKRSLASGFEHMSQEQQVRAALMGGLSGSSLSLGAGTSAGTENFINHMPMLGGSKLTDGAVALRAADPIASEPLGPSQQQYMKENELLEHLLYK